MTRRHVVRVVAGVAALALAGAAATFAEGARRFPALVEEGDVLMRADANTRDPWVDAERVPAALARPALRVEPDLEYRRAVQLFRLSRPGRAIRREELLAEAEGALAEVEQQDASALRRSLAATLLAVMNYDDSVIGGNRDAFLARTFEEFRRAIRTDPENGDAKFDLELALAFVGPDRALQRGRAGGSSGEERANEGAGVSEPGDGY